MKLLKKISMFALAGLACVFPFLSFGCGKTDDNTINLSEVTHSTFYAPLYVAINNGYFDEVGLKINLTVGVNFLIQFP